MSIHTRKQGSTELETFTVKAAGVAVDLTSTPTITWWQRAVGGTTNKVSGAPVVISDAVNGICTFDPKDAGGSGIDAFETAGDFEVYCRIIWSDADETRHPDDGYEIYSIESNFE